MMISPPEPTAGPPLDVALQPRAVSEVEIPNYTYLGCYEDQSERIFSGTVTQFQRNNPNFCCEFCLNQNPDQTLCGVENGRDCWCESRAPDAKSLPASSCNTPCPGAGGAGCGGDWAMGIYSRTNDVTMSASATGDLTAQSVAGYSHLGCFTDYRQRILSVEYDEQQHNNPSYCCEFCLDADPAFTLCGVENGGGCHCDSTTKKAVRAAETDCSIQCPGAAGNQCGGVWRMALYSSTLSEESSVSNTMGTNAVTSTGETAPANTEGDESNAPAEKDQAGGLGAGSIAGIVVGVLVLVLAIAAFLWFKYRRSPKKAEAAAASTAEYSSLQPHKPPMTQYPMVHEVDTGMVPELPGNHVR
jgi:hypothetical protein